MESSQLDQNLSKVKNALREITPRGALVLLTVLGVAFILLSVCYIWLYVQQVQFSYRLAGLYQEQELLLETQRKLKLEWARFEDPYLLEELGRDRFRLAPPMRERKFTMH